MPQELTVLTLSALLHVLHLGAYGRAAKAQLSPDYAMGPRDTPKTLTGVAGRLDRAMTNHFEGLILFAIAAVVIAITDQSTVVSGICAWAYFIARLLYIPAYAYGKGIWRSLVWGIGYLATLVMLIGALI